MLRVLSICLSIVLVGVFLIYDGRVAVFLVGLFTCVGLCSMSIVLFFLFRLVSLGSQSNTRVIFILFPLFSFVNEHFDDPVEMMYFWVEALALLHQHFVTRVSQIGTLFNYIQIRCSNR